MSNRGLKKGDRVSLAGLKAYGMNGNERTSVSTSDDSSKEGRYGVRVDGSKKPISIKPGNIITEVQEDYKGASVGVNDRVLRKGDRVTLVGLKSLEFNGKQGIVVSLSNSSNGGRYGVRVDGTRKPMRVKPANIKRLAKATRELQKDRDEMRNLHNLSEDESANVDQMAMMRMMMNTVEKQIKVFGRKIEPLPDFRLELINEGGSFPMAIDPMWANRYLRRAFEQESALPHTFELHFKISSYQPSQRDLMKRLGQLHRPILEWYYTVEPGDIFKECLIPQHTTCFRYSFSNQAYRK